MTSRRSRARSVALVAAGPAVAAVLFAAGFAAGSSRDGPAHREPSAQPLPDWFLPIWDSYDRNPAVTPDFDFAALYASDPCAVPR
jgi:hypothetical protein